MHEHIQSTTETVTLFALEASATGTMTAEQRHIEQLAAGLGLSRPQLSALHAVMTWAAFLRPSTTSGDRERLRTYLDVMGYLPADRRIVANAERSREAIDTALPELLREIAHGNLNPETFPDAEEANLYQEYTGL